MCGRFYVDEETAKEINTSMQGQKPFCKRNFFLKAYEKGGSSSLQAVLISKTP